MSEASTNLVIRVAPLGLTLALLWAEVDGEDLPRCKVRPCVEK